MLRPTLLLAALLAVSQSAHGTVINITKALWEGEVSVGWEEYADGRPQPQPPGSSTTKRVARSILNDFSATDDVSVHHFFLVESNQYYGNINLWVDSNPDEESFMVNFETNHDCKCEGDVIDGPTRTPGGYVSHSTRMRFQPIDGNASLIFNGYRPWSYGFLHDETAKTLVDLSLIRDTAVALLQGHNYSLAFGATPNGAIPFDTFVQFHGATVRVPEPTTFALLAGGLLGAVIVRRKRLRT